VGLRVTVPGVTVVPQPLLGAVGTGVVELVEPPAPVPTVDPGGDVVRVGDVAVVDPPHPDPATTTASRAAARSARNRSVLPIDGAN
jgi:hypothetical protein